MISEGNIAAAEQVADAAGHPRRRFPVDVLAYTHRIVADATRSAKAQVPGAPSTTAPSLDTYGRVVAALMLERASGIHRSGRRSCSRRLALLLALMLVGVPEL